MLVSTALRLADITYLILMLEIIMYSEGTCVLLEIPSMNKLVQYFQTEDLYMKLKVYILPPLNLIFSQAMLNMVVYQLLIVTNVPVNGAAL